MSSLPAWDLRDLYSGINDPKIELQLKRSKRDAASFERKYKGRLKKSAGSPGKLLKILKDLESLYEGSAKPILYASLKFSESASVPEHGAFLQRMRAETTAIEQHLVFFDLELLGLGGKRLLAFSRARPLENYRNYLVKLIRSAPHRLSEPEEKIMREKSLTGRSAIMRLFEEEFSHAEFEIREGKRIIKVSETKALDRLHDADRKKRAAAQEGFTRGLQSNSRRLLFIFNTLAEDSAVDDRLRAFKSPEDSRHLANEIDRGMVDAMVDAVAGAYKTVQKYYKFKTKILGLKKLYDYDRYAPLPNASESISYARAQEMVVDSFSSFSPAYGRIAKEFFDKKWVDVMHRPGKRGGAYCSFMTPDLHPYVFMNYGGSPRDVSTLAHELGHGIHAYLMRPMGYLNFDVPLTVAETASVFSEMLLFNHLKTQLKTERARFALLLSKIEGTFATVFRQVSMFKFEREFHRLRREGGELPLEAVNRIWRAEQVKMFGNSVELTPNYDYWWSYIPHFLHTPFYVYAYAFGELLTLSLFAEYRSGRKDFVDNYFGMLSAGGSQSPEELTAPFGIDLHSKKFWTKGLSIIDDLVDEAMDI